MKAVHILMDIFAVSIIIGLGITSCGVSHLKARLNAAEAVIDQVWEDQPDYCLDVLVEGDTYQKWAELAK